VTPLTLTVTNAGNRPVGPLTIALEDANKDGFILSKEGIGTLAPGAAESFSVRPKQGLGAGVYTAQLTLTQPAQNDHGFSCSINASFNVSFTVDKAKITGFKSPDAFSAGKWDDNNVKPGGVYDTAAKVGAYLLTQGTYKTVKALYENGETDWKVTAWNNVSGSVSGSGYKAYAPTGAESDAGEYLFEGTPGTPVSDLAANFEPPAGLKPRVTVVISEVRHGAELDASGYAFPAAQYGYEKAAGEPARHSITVKNIGTEATGTLKLEITGKDADAFTLLSSGSQSATLASVAASSDGGGSGGTITVAPALGLTPGSDGKPKTYTATLTVSGADTDPDTGNSDLKSKSCALSFTVTPAEITGDTDLGEIGGGVARYSPTFQTAADVTNHLSDIYKEDITARTAHGDAEGLSISAWATGKTSGVGAASGGYDKDTPGAYVFTGTLEMPSSGLCVNPHGYTATVRVVLDTPTDARAPDVADPASIKDGIVGAEYTLNAAAGAPDGGSVPDGGSSPDGGKISYAWYGSTGTHRPENGRGGVPIPGVTTAAIYKVPTDAPGTMYYWCVVTNDATGAERVTGEKTAERVSALAEVTLRYAALTLDGGVIAYGGFIADEADGAADGAEEDQGLYSDGDAAEGLYAAGDRVGIMALVPIGKKFIKWNSSPEAFAPPAKAEGEITMPAGDLRLTAVFEDAPPPDPDDPDPPVYPPPDGGPAGGPGIMPNPPFAVKTDEGAAAAGEGLPFIDVKEKDWFFDDIGFVYARGLMRGTDAEIFSPNLPITRGMTVTVLGRLYGVAGAVYADTPFTDVAADMYYAPYIRWAANAGIVEGVGEGRFSPDENIKREDMTLILYRYARRALGAEGAFAGYIPFADEAEIDAYAEDGVIWATLQGVINGRPGNVFDPKNSATRAEFAAMLRRFIEEVVEG
jgi:hypothetical protein